MLELQEFKQIASTTHATIDQELLLRNIDAIYEIYLDADAHDAHLSDVKYEMAHDRLKKIQAAYRCIKDQQWIGFARQCWPEIDDYFDFTKSRTNPTYQIPSADKWPDGIVPLCAR